MNKKMYVTSIILIVLVISILVIIHIEPKIELKAYNMIPENERSLLYEFKYGNNSYAILGFPNNNPTYNDNLILLKKNSKYYIMNEIDDCDIYEETIYVKNNSIYIHCIGKKADIYKYELDNEKVKEDVIELNYKNTPNISQLHLFVKKVDDDYIYLYSNIKNNDSITDGNKVKCSLNNKICNYD